MLYKEYSVSLSKVNITKTNTLRIKRLYKTIKDAIIKIYNRVSI